MPRIQCSVCDGENFENIDGYYYCTICGTKSDGIQDIELSDEEVPHGGQNEFIDVKLPSKKAKAKDEEKFDDYKETRDISKNYSTFHVFNYLLRTQCQDLIKIGVDPKIQLVVFALWTKYLEKVGIRFKSESELERISELNLKSDRDKKFFEMYDLNLEHAKETSVKEGALVNDESIKQAEEDMLEDDIIINNDSQESIPNEDTDVDDDDDDDDDDENDQENEVIDEPEEEISDEEAEKSRSEKKILLTHFNWIRMPHTIAVLNLALLLIKSNVLITDLVRFIYNGTISYFNIDEILPTSMKFIYADDQVMFNLVSIPRTDFLRYLTAKLGQYLGFGTIEIIPISQVVARYLNDLNLPYQLNDVVNVILSNAKPVEEFNLEKAKYENVEEVALAYIFTSLFVLFIYGNKELKCEKNSDNEGDLFSFDKWIKEMQNSFENANNNAVRRNFNDVRTLKDINLLKLETLKYRYKLNAKNYISQYRRKEIKDALCAPLLDKDDIKGQNEADAVMTSNLNFISSTLENYRRKSIQIYLDNEDICRVLSALNSKSASLVCFKSFLKDQFLSSEDRCKYLLGVQTPTQHDYLLDVFSEIAQTSYSHMYAYAKKILKI